MTEARFEFGKNWAAFLSTLNEERIVRAEASLTRLFGVARLDGLTFLDIGSGSGLFSLAARRLGAAVTSFDYDATSVSCTEFLREKCFPGDGSWTISKGSALDAEFLKSLGQFDIVYSWGVLHHTGDMWTALKLAADRVANGGQLCVAIYNDQGRVSDIWKLIKQRYVSASKPVQFLMVLALGFGMESCVAVFRLLTMRNPLPFGRWKKIREERGMSAWYDLVDWVGGYPFEVAKPEEIFHLYQQLGFILKNLTTRGGSQGCNELVFSKKL